MIRILSEKFRENRSSYLLYAGSSGVSMMNFLGIALLSHVLIPEDYGVFRYMIMIVTLGISVGSLGYSQSLYYHLSKETDKQYQYNHLNASRIGLIINSLLVFILILIYAYFLYKPDNNFKLYEYFIPVSFIIVIGVLQSIELNVFLSIKKTTGYFINMCALHLIRIVIFYLFYRESLSLYYFFGAMILTAFVSFVINQWMIEKHYKDEKFIIRFDYFKEQLKYGLPIGVGLFFGVLMTQADRMILTYFYKDPVDLAILSNGNFEVPLITIFYISFSTIAFPAMLRAYKEKDVPSLLKHRHHYQKEVAVILFPVVCMLILWSEHLMPVVFGDFYIRSAVYFSVYALSFFIRFGSHHEIFLITNKTRYISYIQGFETLLFGILCFVMIHNFGMIGASIACVVTNLIYVITTTYFSARVLNESFSKMFPYLSLFRILLVSIIIAVPFMFISKNTSGVIPLIAAFVYLSVSILLLYYFESIKKKRA